jgi:sugar/nucleoside kinase (ribokinase family)
VLITLGAGGAALATPDILLHAPAPALSGPQPSGSGSAAEPADRQGRDARAAPQSATGCGDAATAGWLWAILQGCSPEVTLRRAVACGTAKLISADPGNLDKRRVERLLAAARIARI